MVLKSHERKLSVPSVKNGSNIVPYFRKRMNTGGLHKHKMTTEG
jgi:hypothetical protein